MNERQRRFCEYYADNGNATASAKLAGYSSASARNTGYNLLKNDEISTTIHDIQDKKSEIIAQIQAENILSAEDILVNLSAIATDESERTNIRLKALELLGKHYGLFTERIETEIESGGVVILPEIMGDDEK